MRLLLETEKYHITVVSQSNLRVGIENGNSESAFGSCHFPSH